MYRMCCSLLSSAENWRLLQVFVYRKMTRLMKLMTENSVNGVWCIKVTLVNVLLFFTYSLLLIYVYKIAYKIVYTESFPVF